MMVVVVIVPRSMIRVSELLLSLHTLSGRDEFNGVKMIEIRKDV